MACDNDLIKLVKEKQGDEDTLALCYFCLSTSDLLVGGNVFGVVNATSESLTFYFLKPSSFKIVAENVFDTIQIPYTAIKDIKTSKFLIWHTLKLQFLLVNTYHNMNLKLCTTALGIKSQKINVEKLINILKTPNEEN